MWVISWWLLIEVLGNYHSKFNHKGIGEINAHCFLSAFILFPVCDFLLNRLLDLTCYASNILIMYHVFSSKELLRVKWREMILFSWYLNIVCNYWNIYGLALEEERTVYLTLFLTVYKNGNQKWCREKKLSPLFCLCGLFLDPAWI